MGYVVGEVVFNGNVEIGEGTKVWNPQLSNIYGPSRIGKNCNIGALVEIRKDVIIGDNCKIQAFVFIPEGIRIGNNVFIGPHVCFTNDKHPKAVGDWELLLTTIEDDVSIGANATILPGITLGKECVIGAGAVVIKNVPPGCTVVGNPAKIIYDPRMR
jgi:acetyltransferase-like isoleucine patch superfamily enzyme